MARTYLVQEGLEQALEHLRVVCVAVLLVSLVHLNKIRILKEQLMNDSRRFGEPPADLFNPFQRQASSGTQAGQFNPLRAGLGSPDSPFQRRPPAENSLDIPEEKTSMERQIYVDRNRLLRVSAQSQQAPPIKIASSLSTTWSRGLQTSQAPPQLAAPARRKSVDLLISEILKVQEKLESTNSKKYHMQKEQQDLSRQLGLLKDKSQQLRAMHTQIAGKMDELLSYKVVDPM